MLGGHHQRIVGAECQARPRPLMLPHWALLSSPVSDILPPSNIPVKYQLPLYVTHQFKGEDHCMISFYGQQGISITFPRRKKLDTNQIQIMSSKVLIVLCRRQCFMLNLRISGLHPLRSFWTILNCFPLFNILRFWEKKELIPTDLFSTFVLIS